MKHSTIWALAAGVAMVVLAAVLALLRESSPKGLQASNFSGSSTAGPVQEPAVVAHPNAPAIVGFVGDLADGGHLENDGTRLPYVIGDVLEFDADIVNGVQFRWAVNGQPLLDEEKREWSPVLKREFPLNAAGTYSVELQARGDKGLLSQARTADIRVEALHIVSVEPALVEDDDRALVGDEYTFTVNMVDPITADLEFYRFRYFVNDQPIRHPDDDQEWTVESTLSYPLPAPGRYNFRVEVRRADQPAAEASANLPETIIVANSVLQTFDATPEKSAKLGTPVLLGCFSESVTNNAELRFGFKKVVATDWEWIKEENGDVWGSHDRKWVPREPGNYVLRAEVRCKGATEPEDARQLMFTVEEGDF